jgi:protocadherin Fat 1/2/3
VIAYDKDVGPNADIDYSIKSGRGHGRFKIHPKTGMISSDKEFHEGKLRAFLFYALSFAASEIS